MSELTCHCVSLTLGDKQLVNNVSLHIGGNELVGLIGPNGAGKSTLLQMLAGLIKCDTGTVLLNQRDIHAINLQERSRSLAWVEQNGAVNWPLTVERIISLGRRPHLGTWQKPGNDDQQAIEQAIIDTDCTDIRHQNATTLSGGERTRMLLARALAAQPDVLLADEPVAALDLKQQLQAMHVLENFSSADRTCLVVLHDLSLAARFCNRLYLMHEGAIVAEGTPATVLTESNLKTVYGVEVQMGGSDHPWIVPVRAC